MDNVRHLNRARYQEIRDRSERIQAHTDASAFPYRAEAEALLYMEARLLDHRHYEEWLDLFSEDGMYWVPAEFAAGDPRVEASVHFDDLRRLRDRVALIRTGYLHAQIPPARTCRMISNFETWEAQTATLEVHTALTIWVYRPNETIPYVGTQEHVLIRENDAWRIRQKTIRLLNSDAPLGNITFVL